MWRGEKALNLAANMADKPTVGFEICQLEVRGLTLLLHFVGLHLQFRAQNPQKHPLLHLYGRVALFWGKKYDPGRRY